MQFGTSAQKKDILPRILRGEVHLAIGYRARAGTDLASLRTRAVRDGDDWVINGNKIFTSGAGTRTTSGSPRAPIPGEEAQGISMFIVDTKLPGFRVTPLHTVAGYRTNSTYRRPARAASMLVNRRTKAGR